MARLGLFPLPLVLVPTERVPFHIFEPRYRELIGECIDAGAEFGVLLEKPGGEAYAVGTRAAVVDVLRRLPDGRMHIAVEGRERFRVLEVHDDRSFLEGTTEAVEDEDDPPRPTTSRSARPLHALQQTSAQAEEFGVLLQKPGGEAHAVGTRAAVVEVLHRLPDGRLHIAVEGRERFRRARGARRALVPRGHGRAGRRRGRSAGDADDVERRRSSSSGGSQADRRLDRSSRRSPARRCSTSRSSRAWTSATTRSRS